MEDCVFCKIVSSELPACMIRRTPGVSVFMDIRPMNPGHVLVVPNVHHDSTAFLSPLTCSELFEQAVKVASIMKTGPLQAEGVNFFLSDGKAAGQEVPHIHMHVVPRYMNDGIRFKGPNNKILNHADLEDVAGKIRAGLPY